MATMNRKTSCASWIEKLSPEERKQLDLLTPAELEALRRDGEEARRFAIAEFALEDDYISKAVGGDQIDKQT